MRLKLFLVYVCAFLACCLLAQQSGMYRTYGKQLPYSEASKVWSIPATAKGICIYANGLRMTPNVDYTIAAGKLTSTSIPTDALVIADYDQ